MNMSDDIYQELYAAVKNGDLDRVAETFSGLSHVNIRSRNLWVKWPYLHCAGTAEMTKFLLSQGADINAKDIGGLTPLHSSLTSFKDLSVLKELLRLGANVNATDYEGNTPLTLAIIYENLEGIKELMEYGADINMKSTSSFLGYSTSLCIAVRDYKECAKLLIKISVRRHFHKDLRTFITLEPYTAFENYGELSVYLDECIAEIVHMKMYKVNTYCTLYDLVIKGKNRIEPIYGSYRSTEKEILSSYPIYHDIILPQIKTCIDRAKLLDELRCLNIRLIVFSFSNIIVLNSDCFFMITEFLSNDDLLNFIRSVDWNNDLIK